MREEAFDNKFNVSELFESNSDLKRMRAQFVLKNKSQRLEPPKEMD